jgi:hypothetical protein
LILKPPEKHLLGRLRRRTEKITIKMEVGEIVVEGER